MLSGPKSRSNRQSTIAGTITTIAGTITTSAGTITNVAGTTINSVNPRAGSFGKIALHTAARPCADSLAVKAR